MARRKDVLDRWLTGDTGILAATDSAEGRLLASVGTVVALQKAAETVGLKTILDDSPQAAIKSLLPDEIPAAVASIGDAIERVRLATDPVYFGRQVVAKLRSSDAPAATDPAGSTYWHYILILLGTGYVLEKAGQAGIPSAAAEMAKAMGSAIAAAAQSEGGGGAVSAAVPLLLGATAVPGVPPPP